MRIVAAGADKLTIRTQVAGAHPEALNMSSHDEFLLVALCSRHVHIHHRGQLHSWLEIQKRLTLMKHRITLQVTTLTDLHPKLSGQLFGIDDTRIRFACGICDRPTHDLAHMGGTWAMASFTIDTLRQFTELIVRPCYKLCGHGVVAAHALQADRAGKAFIEPIFKTGRQIGHLTLGIIGKWHLIDVAHSVHQMGIGVLPRSDDIVHLLCQTMQGICTDRSRLVQKQTIRSDAHAIGPLANRIE